MPLRARLNGDDIQSFNYSESEWMELKSSYAQQALIMACCDRKAIPKKSKLGTQYFAHAKRGDCTTAPETADHLKLKALVALSATAQGWSLTTEEPGETPDGEKWVADVMCQKGNARVAIEVQWSHQTRAEFERRTQKYLSSGVRCAWLFRLHRSRRYMSKDFEDAYNLPYFGFRDWCDGYQISRYKVSLEEFVAGMLSGKLVCHPSRHHPLIYRIIYDSEDCVYCDKKTNFISTVKVLTEKGDEVARKEFDDPEVAQWVRDNFSDGELRFHGIGPLKLYEGSFFSRSKFVNHCINCGRSSGYRCPVSWLPDIRYMSFEVEDGALKSSLEFKPLWTYDGKAGELEY